MIFQKEKMQTQKYPEMRVLMTRLKMIDISNHPKASRQIQQTAKSKGIRIRKGKRKVGLFFMAP